MRHAGRIKAAGLSAPSRDLLLPDRKICRWEKEDAVAWLAGRLAKRHEKAVHVIYHTIAWQYSPEAAQREGLRLIADAGKTLTAMPRFAISPLKPMATHRERHLARLPNPVVTQKRLVALIFTVDGSIGRHEQPLVGCVLSALIQ